MYGGSLANEETKVELYIMEEKDANGFNIFILCTSPSRVMSGSPTKRFSLN